MKTAETLALEKAIVTETRMRGMFGCLEVTIGYYGAERVDFLTYDHKGVWRCYEIKTSISDFRSKAAKSFVGHCNYFVLTSELYEKVKDEIEPGIGVYIGRQLVVKPKRRQLKVSEHTLMKSMIRSLSREANRAQDNLDEDKIGRYKREIARATEDNRTLRRQNMELYSRLNRERSGTDDRDP